MFDFLAATNFGEKLGDLMLSFRRSEDVDVPSNDLGRGIAVFSALIPGCNDPVDVLADDAILRALMMRAS
jgi:hypothetical protein